MSAFEASAGTVTVESVPPVGLDDQVCLASFSNGAVSWICAAPAVATYWVGCIHEHGETTPVCERCAAEVEAGVGWCRKCAQDSDGPHDCRLLGRRLP